MQSFRMILTILFALAAILWLVATAQAAGPRNPYSSFNLSGINYGAQQWERAQRQGRVVWPYYNVPSRSSGRSWSPTSGVYVGGVVAGGSGAGTIIQGGAYRPTQRSPAVRSGRRWRR